MLGNKNNGTVLEIKKLTDNLRYHCIEIKIHFLIKEIYLLVRIKFKI